MKKGKLKNSRKSGKLKNSRKKGKVKKSQTTPKRRGTTKKVKKSQTSVCRELLTAIKGIEDLLLLERAKYEQIKKCVTIENRNNFENGTKTFNVYPHLDDLRFSEKITKTKEFYDAKMLKHTKEDFNNIKEVTNTLCDENIANPAIVAPIKFLIVTLRLGSEDTNENSNTT